MTAPAPSTSPFSTGYDLDIAAVDVQNRVTTRDRPPAAGNQEHRHHHHQGESATSSSRAGFYSPDGSAIRTSSSRNYLDVYVKDALKRVPGVGDVMIFGERKYAMRIWLDPDQAGRPQTDGNRRRECAAGAERRDSRRPARAAASRSQAGLPDFRARGRPAHRSPRSSTTSL